MTPAPLNKHLAYLEVILSKFLELIVVFQYYQRYKQSM